MYKPFYFYSRASVALCLGFRTSDINIAGSNSHPYHQRRQHPWTRCNSKLYLSLPRCINGYLVCSYERRLWLLLLNAITHSDRGKYKVGRIASGQQQIFNHNIIDLNLCHCQYLAVILARTCTINFCNECDKWQHQNCIRRKRKYSAGERELSYQPSLTVPDIQPYQLLTSFVSTSLRGGLPSLHVRLRICAQMLYFLLQIIDNSRRWWLVQNQHEEKGYVPSTVLELATEGLF